MGTPRRSSSRKALHLAAQTVAIILLTAAIHRPGAAFAEVPAARVTYLAGEGCPGAEQFSAAVLARGRSVLVVDAGSPSAIRVSVAADAGGGYRGTLRLGSSEEGTREVHGAMCRDVIEALAVVTVSSLGPPDAARGEAPIGEGPSGVVIPGDTPAKTTAPPAPAKPVAGPPIGRVHAAPSEVSVRAGTLKFGSNTAMSVFGGIATGIIPGVIMPRFDFEVARTNLVTSPEGSSYHLLPTVRLHGSVFPYWGQYHSSFGTTEGNGLGVGADLCDPLYYDQTGLQLFVCVDFLIGYFGLSTKSPQGVSGPLQVEGFGTAGAGLDLTYNIGRHFNVGLKAGGDLVVGGLVARASDGSQIFKSSLLSLHVLLGIGGHF